MDWKTLYQLAILEPDPARLPVRVADAQAAIFDRLEATFTEAHGREYRELNEALKGLRLVHKWGDRRIDNRIELTIPDCESGARSFNDKCASHEDNSRYPLS